MIASRPSYHHCWASFLVFSTVCVSLVYAAPYPISGNETDRLALLEFKAKITVDPLGIMSSWNDSMHFCNWFGVTCSKRHRRVTKLVLESIPLGGSVSPHIGSLTFLRIVILDNNTLINQIPSEIGYLRRLEQLYLPNNSLSGEIPTNLSRCSQLVRLSLVNNMLTGVIPKEIGLLTKLQYFSVYSNNLSGEIPKSLGNLSSLIILSVGANNLVGSIPNALGKLNQLPLLTLESNKLYGGVPSLQKLNVLNELLIYDNFLGTRGPECISNLSSKLAKLFLSANQISGSIPAGVANLISLTELLADNNKLSGKVPSLQNLNALEIFYVPNNSLGARRSDDLSFLCSLTNASDLLQLDISNNDLGGSLPECIGNWSSKLKSLSVSENQIFSGITESLGNLSNLHFLDLSRNYLSGFLPPEVIVSLLFFSRLNKITYMEVFLNHYAMPPTLRFWTSGLTI